MKYRLSYTTLSRWERGESDTAIASYLGKPHPYPTPVMELGKAKHELWEREIKKTAQIPQELGGGRLRAPITERKHERLIDVGDGHQIELVGVIDLEANGTLYDWKVSIRNVNAFAGSWQKQYYKLLIPEAKRFEFRAYNPILETYGIAVCYLTDKDIDEGLEKVISLSTDFIATLEQMYGSAEKLDLLSKYKPQEAVV